MNLLADPTFQTHAVISGDGAVVDNGDGTFRIDFTGAGGSSALLDLTAALIPGHRYDLTFDATGAPQNLKGQLLQDGYNIPSTAGVPPNLSAAGSYGHVYTYGAPVARVRVMNYAMSGHAFSVSNISVVDLDA